MSNLTRYSVKFHSNRHGGPVYSFFEDPSGEYVKFDDIKEFLKPTANTARQCATQILLCSVSSEECHSRVDGRCNYSGSCSWQRKTSAVA